MTAPHFATKAEWVYEHLRGRIVAGELKPGDRLRLTDIARGLGISEMPVREALRMLHRDRLVAMESHRGATVTDLPLERAIEIIEVRTQLEVLALTLAAGRHDAVAIKQLRERYAAMDEAISDSNAQRFSELNREFHRLAYAPGSNATLRDEIEELWDRVWRTRTRTIFAEAPARMRATQQEHRAILKALVRGSPVDATTAATAHREATLAAWRELLVQQQGTTPAAPPAERRRRGR